jgi:protein phosphatase
LVRRKDEALSLEQYVNDRPYVTTQQVDEAQIERHPLWTNLKHMHGPFDIIGDVHGCFDELEQLLEQLGHVIQVEFETLKEAQGNTQADIVEHYLVSHPQGRTAILLGDLVDRGPASHNVLRFMRVRES